MSKLLNKFYKLHPQPTSLKKAIETAKRANIRGKVILDPFCGTGTILLACMVARAKKAIGSDIEDYNDILRADFGNPFLKTWLRTDTEVELHWHIDALESIHKFEHDVLFTDPPNPVALLGGTQISVVRDIGLHGSQIRKFWSERLSKQNLMGKGQRTVAYVIKLVKTELENDKRVIVNLFRHGNFSYKRVFEKVFKIKHLYANWFEVIGLKD